MRKIEKILLLGEKTYLVDKSMKKFHTEFGVINLAKITKYGQTIKTNTGKKFLVVEPTITDLLRKCKRMPQIVTPKDAAQIAAYTGLSSGWHCLDFGGGSGFLSLFMGNLVKPDGSVVTYEKNKDYVKNIDRNIKFCGLSDIITAKNKEAKSFTEKNLDLITMDVIDAETYIKKCYNALKPGGFLVIYSPHIEQQKKVMDEIRKMKFIQVKTLQTSQTTWQVNDFSHPVPSQLVHTGFMTFARKI